MSARGGARAHLGAFLQHCFKPRRSPPSAHRGVHKPPASVDNDQTACSVQKRLLPEASKPTAKAKPKSGSSNDGKVSALIYTQHEAHRSPHVPGPVATLTCSNNAVSGKPVHAQPGRRPFGTAERRDRWEWRRFRKAGTESGGAPANGGRGGVLTK